jgi:2,3-bisphosphoglycerate-dependent phosphoglycerate mutase
VSTHGNLLTLLLHSIDPIYGFETWCNLSNPDLFLLRDDGHGSFEIEHISVSG